MKFSTEKESIDYFTQSLSLMGYTDIEATQSTNQFSHYDVSATHPTGLKFEFELKRRNFPSTNYGDTIIETSKYDKMMSDIEEGKADRAILITFFDDAWTVSDVRKPIDEVRRMANHTTYFADNNYVRKSFMRYNFVFTFPYK